MVGTPRREPRLKTRSLLLTLAVAACTGPTDVENVGGPLIHTSAPSYSLVNRGETVGADIPFTFVNRTGADVYLAGCTGAVPPFLERKKGSDWEKAWEPTSYSCNLSGPVRIAPGEIRADTLFLYAFPLGDQRRPQFENLDVAGTYRLRWDKALSSYDATLTPPGAPIPLAFRVSNEFQLQGEYRAVPPDRPKLTYLEVTASKNSIVVGDSAKMTATGLDQFYKPIAVTDSIFWWSTQVVIPPGQPGPLPGVVDILPGGTVIGVRPGWVTVHGMAGSATGRYAVEVVPE